MMLKVYEGALVSSAGIAGLMTQYNSITGQEKERPT